LQRTDGKVLVSERSAGKSLPGYLEFPGGKIESGETPAAALERELDEELGLAVDASCLRPLIRFEHVYPEFDVRLYVYRLEGWAHEPVGREGQRLSWQPPADLFDAPLLPADRPILNALALPSSLLITPRLDPGKTGAFRHRLEQALVNEPGGVVLRVSDPALLESLARPFAAARTRGQILIFNSGDTAPLPPVFHGLHLPAAALTALEARPAVDGWIGASVHHVEEAVHARRLGLDYVIAGSVRETPSHPGIEPLGWGGFEKIAATAGIPTYAIGGVGLADLPRIRARWGQGVAAIRAFWPETV
jgi:8-oxo-dGTP diphosphatase